MDDTRWTWVATLLVGFMLVFVVLRWVGSSLYGSPKEVPDGRDIHSACLAEFGQSGDEWGTP